jgi:ankyrin repeat protein
MASELDERLWRAAKDADVAGIAAALLAGVDPDAFEGSQVWTPLQWAAYNGHVAAIAALLAAGARVDGTDCHGTTPLMLAASHSRTVAIDALLAAGADIQHANKVGFTALHHASMWGHLDAARVLVDAGARTDAVTIDGNRPIDMVRALHRSLEVPSV